MGTYYLIIMAFALISAAVSNRLKSKFKKYAKVNLRNGLSGREIAEQMLSDHGITDVKVVSTPVSYTHLTLPTKA